MVGQNLEVLAEAQEVVVLSRLAYVRWGVVGPRTLLLWKLKRSKTTMLRVARDQISRKMGELVVCSRPKTRRDVDRIGPLVLAE